MSTLIGGMCIHAAIWALCIFIVFLICDCLCPFFFKFFLSDIETPDRNGQTQRYQHLLTLWAIFLQERYRKDHHSDYVCMFYIYVMCMFCIVFNLCAKFEFVKALR